MSDLIRKSATVEVKDADKGVLRVVFATMGVKDLDGDWILPGAFGRQKVAMSAYGHSWMDGVLPVGKGSIYEDGDKAIADLQVFMDTQAGRDHFQVIKEMGDIQEYSFGFRVLKTGELTEALRQKGVYQVIAKVKVFEVSPVLVGAGIDTGTLSAKGAKEPTAEVIVAPIANKVRCNGCGYFLGESVEPLVAVGKSKSREEIEAKFALPRDVRACKGCGHFVVFSTLVALQSKAA